MYTIKLSEDATLKEYMAFLMPYFRSQKLNSVGIIGNDYFESYRNLSEFLQSRDRYLINYPVYEMRIFQNKQGKHDIDIVYD